MTAFILSGFDFTPSGVLTCPKYATSFHKNSLLSSCILKFAFLNLSKTSFSFSREIYFWNVAEAFFNPKGIRRNS